MGPDVPGAGGLRTATAGDGGASAAPRVASGWLVERKIRPSDAIVMQSAPRSVAAEKFRRLKTTLTHLSPAPRVIVVTSGAPGEGKSTVSLNLALAFASREHKALLIDADLRRPTIDLHLDPEPGLGLTEVLRGEAELRHAILGVAGAELQVLPSGTPVAEPLELLARPRMAEIVGELRESYDVVIIDTPPVLPFTDATQLASLSDGVLLVVRAAVTPEAVLVQSIDALAPSRILGIVFNDSGTGVADGQYYYDRYYHAYYDRDREVDGTPGGGGGAR